MVAGVFDDEPGLDLVLRSAVDDSIRVLSGVGDGTFKIGEPWVPAGTVVASMAAGDISGDGFDDLVITAWPDVRAALIANGSGTFSAPVMLPGMGGTPAVLDVDGAGGLDVAFRTGTFGLRLEIVLSAADNQFVVLSPLAPGVEFGGTPVMTDFTGDGLRDLVVCSEGALSGMTGPGLLVFPGTTEGEFGKAHELAMPHWSGLPGPIVRFWCRGVLAPNGIVASAIAHGVAELGSGEHIALALTFTGLGEEAAFVRGEVLSKLAPGPEEAYFMADVSGDGVLDAIGRGKAGTLTWYEGTEDMAFARVANGVSLRGASP
jgi:hypothetical protein